MRLDSPEEGLAMDLVIGCRLKPYIQPFERELAIRELAALTGVPAAQLADISPEGRAELRSGVDLKLLASRLAYWESVGQLRDVTTVQVLREATANIIRNGIPIETIPFLLTKLNEALPNRRCLRYGTHGIHEYRGKFFPQLVRALINISGLKKNALVGDPMCGSGTTCVEARLSECRAIGLDMNPLSTFVARTKADLLTSGPEQIAAMYDRLRKVLVEAREPLCPRLQYFKTLLPSDQHYLKSWFAEQVLEDLDAIAQAIESLEDGPSKQLALVSLSNILRRVSWQKVDDLRIRKDVKLEADINPIREFLEELGRSVRLVLAFLYREGVKQLPCVDIREGDARQLQQEWRRWTGEVDTIITSPPYATALPYLDTDRLGLCYLGLLGRPKHRSRDVEMIGNREITPKLRAAYWDQFRRNPSKLPASITSIISRVNALNSQADVGFRRRNLPALLSKYFIDMQQVLSGVHKILRPGATAYVVVGSNHTIAGGVRVDIDTPTLLADMSEALGFGVESRVPMEMLVSRDIFRKNAVATEEILFLRKPN
jgi:DNA modification methylase